MPERVFPAAKKAPNFRWIPHNLTRYHGPIPPVLIHVPPRDINPRIPMNLVSPDTAERILEVLAHVAESDEVCSNPDLALYDLQVLDSMKTVELIVALSAEIGVEISPAEFERENWATPRQLVADVLGRLAA
jgi:D-alanine--poly(phosphoribitol) ligase subunit 2